MPENPDIRWRQRFQSFQKALAELQEAVALANERELSKLERQGLIQAFEFTHELAWNTLKDYFVASGSTARLHGSRDVTREAFSTGLIENGEAWMRMIEHRNLTTHTYHKETADEIARAILTRYVLEFETFQSRFMELERDDA